jgi:hypothetical protein
MGFYSLDIACKVAFSSAGMKAAATKVPMFAYATEALISRLPTVNG